MNRPRWIHARPFQRLKNLFCSILFNLGFFDLVRAMSNKLRRGAVILYYHRVVDGDPDPYFIPGTQVDLRGFTAQIGGLSRKYKIIPSEVLVERLKKGLLDPTELALSFLDHCAARKGQENIGAIIP